MLNANRWPVQPNRRTFPSDGAGCVNEQLPGFGCIGAKKALQLLLAQQATGCWERHASWHYRERPAPPFLLALHVLTYRTTAWSL